MRAVLQKALTDKHLLILREASLSPNLITPLLYRISDESGIPLSTLKSSTKSLRELGLITYGTQSDPVVAEPTPAGSAVLEAMGISVPGAARRSM